MIERQVIGCTRALQDSTWPAFFGLLLTVNTLKRLYRLKSFAVFRPERQRGAYCRGSGGVFFHLIRGSS